ncbi:alpha-L-rhamnosidase [Anditalea andensis]|uniref:alpha-L-rhamnosidase n=1 Tax=Anditalea andensis TaxID=1048983 RepID=A0A074KZ98_9BACT|nr:alpha-L-rhamnosidase [Anditalea andensis]KEO74239.1 alpha-rhamnosidase [Anditalea andensis]
MTISKSFIFILFVLGYFASVNFPFEQGTEGEAVDLSNLKVEMLTNPEGIDVLRPRLSWQLQGDAAGIKQTAYQVLVASSLEILAQNEGDLWNSGKVEEETSIHVKYDGKPLQNRMEAYWKVRVWTSSGESNWSEPSHWSMGIMYYNDWKSTRWIGMDRAFDWDEVSTFSRLSARYFRKEFNANKEIKQAKVHLMGLGLYELYINGEKIGDQVLAPVPTDYNHNVKINVFDVSDQLRQGENAIGVILGNGRFFTMRQDYKPYKIKTFGFPKMALQLHIEYLDGSKVVIRTDESWDFTADGPIRTNNEYDGEEYDARKEMPGWNLPGFDTDGWLKASYVQEPEGTFEAQMTPNMKIMGELKPIGISKLEQDRYILDMGQNMVGWLHMKVRGNQGQKVTLRFAESLKEDGELFVRNLRDAKVTDIYTLKGGEEEDWEPKFVYHGFRYVEITGYPGTPSVTDFTGKMVYDDIKTVGSFETSDPTINQIYQNSWWGIAGNYKGMPVDCPQRNERQPWLGDRSTGALGENFMFDNARLYTKWIDDIRYSQRADGSIPDVAPAFWRYYSDNMTWPGTMLMIVDMLYQQTGDVQVIEDNYQAMKKWLEYMRINYMDENYILTKDSYGDWCVPPPTIEAATGQNADVKNPSKLISTAYHYYFMDLMADFASRIGREPDIPEYRALGTHIKAAFNDTFYNKMGYYGDNKMTDNLLALAFGLVNENHKQKVFNSLVETIEVENKGHLSTGVIGTQWLMRTLTQNGRADLAFRIATNRTYPSWGYMLENGATTIWELWHGNVANPSMNSQNHVMLLGDLIVWYYENLAGIKADPANPGFKNILMDPSFIDQLDFVKASHESIYGKISSHWIKNGTEIQWDITVPANATAEVFIPAKDVKSISNYKKRLEKSNQIADIQSSKTGKVKLKLMSGKYSFSFPTL